MGNVIVCWMVVILGVECFGCSNHCLCYTWGNLLRTDCVRKNLYNTFIGLSHQTQVLDLSYNVISVLHGNEFLDANLRKLQDLRLSNNRLHKIDKFAFNGLEFLKHLDLSHNSLDYLHPSTFKYNPDLKILNVSFNLLEVKKDEAFLSPAPSLNVLDMASCRLEIVTYRTFADLKRLHVLNISRNYVRVIETELLERMENLKYLDLSKSGLPCGDQTKPLLRALVKHKIQFQAFCQTSWKELTSLVLETTDTNRLEVEVNQGDYIENVTQRIQHERSLFNDVTQFFQSIPSFYAIVCGVQLGVFIGSFSTYFCLKNSIKTRRGHVDRNSASREKEGREEPDDTTFVLVPLNTPPGTPPSPYHSRFFPSNFSLSAT